MKQAGFTLLELMVSMALLALVTLGVAGGLRFGLQAWNRMDADLDRGEPVAAAQTFLRQTLERAAPLPAGAPGAIAFTGSSSGLSFVAVLPARVAAPGLSAVTLELAPSTAGTALVLSWQPYRGAGESGRKTLLDGLAGGGFLYYGPGAAPGDDWQEEWTSARALPRLVALRLAFKDPRILWPPLLIAPPAVPDALVPAT